MLSVFRFALLLLSTPAIAATVATAPADCCPPDWLTGKGVSVGGIVFPEVNFQSAFGTSTADDPASLAVGHHDPDREGFTIQNIEFSMSARLGKHIRAFATYATKIDLDEHWADEFEEYYAEFEGLPLELRVKGGRFYTRFGMQNLLHPHDFTFVDQYLASGRFVGEDSATIYGGEISLPVLGGALPAGWDDRLSVSYGTVPDAEEESHAQGEEAEALFEGEGAFFQDWLATANYALVFKPRKDTRYELGISGAWGRNNFDRHTQLYGLHLDALWLSAGDAGCVACEHEPTHFLRWRTEVFVRRFGAAGGAEEHAHEEAAGEHEAEGHDPAEGDAAEEEAPAPARRLRDTFTDAGLYTMVSYGFPGGKWQAHLRGEYVSGTADAGLVERWRVSPAIGWRPSERLPITVKLQYNYDHSPDFGDEHSVWLQFGLKWGDCCAHTH